MLVNCPPVHCLDCIALHCCLCVALMSRAVRQGPGERKATRYMIKLTSRTELSSPKKNPPNPRYKLPFGFGGWPQRMLFLLLLRSCTKALIARLRFLLIHILGDPSVPSVVILAAASATSAQFPPSHATDASQLTTTTFFFFPFLGFLYFGAFSLFLCLRQRVFCSSAIRLHICLWI